MANEKKNLPPYLSYPTFRSFIESLHKTVVIPDHIDKTLMPRLSGGVQSHLMTALRFLGLMTGDDNATTPALRELVSAFGDETKWPAALGAVVTAAYKPIIGSLDISKASVGALEEAFRKSGLDGLMLERVVRFYIRAVKESNVPLSPFISNRKPRMPVRRANGKAAKAVSDSPTKPAEQTPPPENPSPPKYAEGSIQFPIYLSGGRTGVISVPKDLTEADLTMVNSMVAAVQAYAAVPKDGAGN